MKTTLIITVGIVTLLSTVTNRITVNSSSDSEFEMVSRAAHLDKGSYLASEFAQFKRDNLREDLNVVVPVSDKVLFKAFVKSKQQEKLK